jgi:hypothetical protein
MSNTIEVKNWTNFFKDFSAKNLKRPARLETFGELGALEQVKKLPFAGIYVETAGANAPRVEILLGGLSATKVDYLTHTILNVKSIMNLSGSDNFDSAIEFEAADGTKTLLSFEPKAAETQAV